MPRTDYYDTDAKFLGSWGSGTPIARRLIPKDVYQATVNSYVADPVDVLARETGNFPGARQAIVRNIVTKTITPYRDGIDVRLQARSQALNIQSNGADIVAGLVRDAQRTRKEQGAYIVLQYSQSKVMYSVATPTSSSEVDFNFSVVRHGAVRLVPADHTLQIIATVHTHYADVAAMNAASRGVRHSIAPQVSDLDRNSAMTEKIVVYAVDANYVHKAHPNGQVWNKLNRNLDIIIDAIESYGRS